VEVEAGLLSEEREGMIDLITTTETDVSQSTETSSQSEA